MAASAFGAITIAAWYAANSRYFKPRLVSSLWRVVSGSNMQLMKSGGSLEARES
ncbi:MAG: hypothetical protein KAJ53_01545 [Anaerolineales bacterium]|nr:hypothetical protein [Anaerolineales bacterium]